MSRFTEQPPSRLRLPERNYVLTLNHFVIFTLLVIAVQGTYLGYLVGMLTTLEKRFGFSSEQSGMLLSFYDIGHTVSILFVGYFASHSHLPRITGFGVLLSAVSMFLLITPIFFYGTVNHDAEVFSKRREEYSEKNKCNEYREVGYGSDSMLSRSYCNKEEHEHAIAFVLLAFGQLLAGIASSPFNTLAYVYIDTNVKDKRQSPFLLGLLTSTYAFGPAIGFALSAALNQVYTTLGSAPLHVNPGDSHWIGAWWLGLLLLGFFYLFLAIPFFFFPKSYKYTERGVEMHPLNKPHLHPHHFEEEEDTRTGCQKLADSLKEFPYVVWDLVRNPIYVTMVIAWMCGSYLIGGYQTYLPKYIETQFGRTASAADIYAGVISVGSIAVSTALGGWLLTKWDISPRKALLCLIGSWSIIVATYLLGMLFGCDQADITGLKYEPYAGRWHLNEHVTEEFECSSSCQCSAVMHFEGVNFDGMNFFSPCHAGCRDYDRVYDRWSNCDCARNGESVSKGLVHPSCDILFGYLALMYFGLFAGNLFFMVNMMIILRSVYDDQKVMALSLASCITNALGFIPAPLIYGWIIDYNCILWSSRCPHDRGNCVLYDNSGFRVDFHLSNAIIQALAVVFALICYLVSRTKKLPEEEGTDVDENGTAIH